MMKNFRRLACVFIFFLVCGAAWPADFGLILDQGAGFGGFGSDSSFDYTGMLIPRFSGFIGDNGDLYVSAGFRFDYPGGFVPELLRTELNFRSGNGVFSAGRLFYSDPPGFVADGLFDGLRYSLDTDIGSFGMGLFYTGFLYKKRANITMNSVDLAKSGGDVKYDDFLNTYFAPRRVIAAFDWNHPGINDLVRFSASLLGQLDLNESLADGLHTQYLSAKATIPFSAFTMSLGLCFELAQLASEFKFALAGEAEAVIYLPTKIEDQLTITGRYSSGMWDDNPLMAFVPISSKNQGDILKAKFSGISLVSLNYLARFNKTMALEGSSTYFFRNDLGTYTAYGNEGYLLGNEFFARFFWNPFSDLSLNAGAGVFLPSLGNAAPKADLLWRAELNLILSLY